MRIKWLPFLFLLVSSSALAQESPALRACESRAKTQREFDVCAVDESKRVDADLDRVFSRLLTLAAKTQGAVAKIRVAQSAWLAYRDAYVEAMFPAEDKQAEYGSSYLMKLNLLYATLAQRQIAALELLLDEYGPR
jgi:uncharacterized protein YecT (DUF1311 family)